MTQFAIVLDASGNGIGSHSYGDAPATYPADETPCTEAQARNPAAWSLVNGALVASLGAAQGAQIIALTASYNAANAAPISFITAASVAKTYQADPASLANLTYTLLGFQKTGAVPSGFYWQSADNTQVLFTYADLQGLAEALTIRGNTNFQKLQTLKTSVRAATTVDAVQAIIWPAS